MQFTVKILNLETTSQRFLIRGVCCAVSLARYLRGEGFFVQCHWRDISMGHVEIYHSPTGVVYLRKIYIFFAFLLSSVFIENIHSYARSLPKIKFIVYIEMYIHLHGRIV